MSLAQKWNFLLSLRIARGDGIFVPEMRKKRFGFGSSRRRSESPAAVKPSSKMSPAFVNVTGDQRFHAAVEIEGERFVGLLDSGAEVTVVGPRFQELIASGRVRTKPAMFSIRTADGTVHTTEHVLVLNINYLGHAHVLEAPMLLSLKHDLVLGVDFWLKFNIRPAINEVCSIEAEKQVSVAEHMELSDSEASQLKIVLNGMPFGKAGILSKTTLTKHAIDTGGAAPIKQTQYIISPYVQKEVHAEIDRLLSIGAIFPCSSASDDLCSEAKWKSPFMSRRSKTKCGDVQRCISAAAVEPNFGTAIGYARVVVHRLLRRLSSSRARGRCETQNGFLHQRKRVFRLCSHAFWAVQQRCDPV